MQNINTANNSKLNVRFCRPRRVGKIAIIISNCKGEEHPDFVDFVTTLTDRQPSDCNNCKAQRKPRWFRKRKISLAQSHLMFNENN